MRSRQICELAPVIPVLTIEDVSHARPLAEALVSGGLPALEVTLRTPAALQAIREISHVPGAVVGAGTLISAEQVSAAVEAGANFGVSPGTTSSLLEACSRHRLALLPGVATATEAMTLLQQGFDLMKFFPAESIGGASALNALAGPLPQIDFCPTGGINESNAGDYLSLPNVPAVGGSWVAPSDLIHAGQWDQIENLARAASQL